jgi:hypothetical protein
MNQTDCLVDQVIVQALVEVADRGMSGRIVTIALYFDHESPALSVCADTLESSDKHTDSSLTWNYGQFAQALNAGDVEDAALFNASVGRSLSLGDFALVNLARRELDTDDDRKVIFEALAKGLHRNMNRCLGVCDPNQRIVFACSTQNSEVGLFWSPPHVDSKANS